MPYLNRLRSGTLRSLRLMVVAFGLIGGNIGLELLYNGYSFLFWLPLALLSIFLLVFPLLIKRELNNRPLEERQFTPKQIYSGMGLAHLAIILAGIYRLLTVRDAEWRLIIIVVIVLATSSTLSTLIPILLIAISLSNSLYTL